MSKPEPPNVNMTARNGENAREALARNIAAPVFRHSYIAATYAEPLIEHTPGDKKPGIGDFFAVAQTRESESPADRLEAASRLLTEQAQTLDMLFTELARRSAANMGQYPKAMETYMRLALKAQANSRATIEALAKLHQPKEQTVRHVHVNDGGQAIITDQFHHHTGGAKNAQSLEQPHAPGPNSIGKGTSLPSPNPFGDALPVTSGKRGKTMPDARRKR